MTTRNEDQIKDCTFQWKIENASHYWWLKLGERIDSPTFVADALVGTKWTLRLYPMGNKNKNYIGFYLHREKDCSGPDVIEVNFQLAFLRKNGLFLKERIRLRHSFPKNSDWGFSEFETRERVFFTKRVAFLPEETLTVQCTLWKTDENLVKSKYLYGRTGVKVNRKSFIWRIDEFSNIETDTRYEFKDTLFDFHLILNTNFDKLDIDLNSWHDGVKYISFYVSIIDTEGKRVNCGIKNYFASDLKEGVLLLLQFPEKLREDKNRYFPNDVLSLEVEFVYSTIEYFGFGEKSTTSEIGASKTNECYAEEKKSEQKKVLIDDFKSLYNEGIFSDTQLRTSTKTFPAHKGILSARSPVFRRMFNNDMKEANSGHVVIADFEDDTVHRMLLYIYTDTLDDLQFESASELYKIADKYEILSLKSRCSSFLKDTLCPTKVCDVLMLADLHQDDNLKNDAEVYILENGEVFNSLEWKNLMDSNIKLAADVMYKSVNTVRI